MDCDSHTRHSDWNIHAGPVGACMALCAVLLAVYMLTDQPVLGQPYAVSVSGACMEACRAKLRMIMFASCLLCFFPARESASAGRIWRPMIKPNMQCSRCRRQGEPNAVGGRARKGMQSSTCAIAEMRVGWMMGLSPWWCGPVSFGEMSSNPRLRVTDGHSCRSFHLQTHRRRLAAPRIIPEVSSHIRTRRQYPDSSR
jgi:hypothetical protein